MLPLVEGEEQVASDMYCLVGRIFKDTFLESDFTDTQSRDNGALWWESGQDVSVHVTFLLSQAHSESPKITISKGRVHEKYSDSLDHTIKSLSWMVSVNAGFQNGSYREGKTFCW